VFGLFVAALGSVALSIALSAGGDGSDLSVTAGGAFGILAVLLFCAYFGTALAWIYKSWAMLPPHLRQTANGTAITPGAAVAFLFVPFYNLYWYFKVSAGLASALNRVLDSYGSPKRASRGLGITAATFQVIPYANLLLAPFIWVAFMFSVESAKREYARVSSAGTP
jgi:hypothetical protein